MTTKPGIKDFNIEKAQNTLKPPPDEVLTIGDSPVRNVRCDTSSRMSPTDGTGRPTDGGSPLTNPVISHIYSYVTG
ncbi:hypothetical protein GDO81_020762 [Engystomops pustulosus]|uniref:Uncharacterized protein n=1 Tax=Engystomops pustulosus TaxID=76066 RepID=A0AAV6ZHY6_ENGPU|nr:hypothetical protein GDO81_020762 [Engystomops pustulosus]